LSTEGQLLLPTLCQQVPHGSAHKTTSPRFTWRYKAEPGTSLAHFDLSAGHPSAFTHRTGDSTRVPKPAGVCAAKILRRWTVLAAPGAETNFFEGDKQNPERAKLQRHHSARNPEFLNRAARSCLQMRGPSGALAHGLVGPSKTVRPGPINWDVGRRANFWDLEPP